MVTSIGLATMAIMGLLEKRNVISVAPKVAPDFTVKAEKALKDLGMKDLPELQRVSMGLLLTMFTGIEKPQNFVTGKLFSYICKQLGIDGAVAMEAKTNGESLDKVVKSLSQGMLFTILIGILNVKKSYVLPKAFKKCSVPVREGAKVPDLMGLSAELLARMDAVG